MTAETTLLLLRELDALHREVERYPTDASLWATSPGVPNVGGTLVLHLTGNLRYFIGATIGGSGYVRDREAEFSQRGITKSELLTLITTTRSEVEHGLSKLSDAALEAPFPVVVGGRSMSTRLFILHLLSHLAYHLGQIDYHRRMTTGDTTSANTLPLSGLGVGSA